MRAIKLEFTDTVYLDQLINDTRFAEEIHYLNPNRINGNNLVLFDPVPQHDYLDTEAVILSIFARAIKRIMFSNTAFEIEFLNPFVNQQKGGVHHNGTRIITSTDIQIATIVTTSFK